MIDLTYYIICEFSFLYLVTRLITYSINLYILGTRIVLLTYHPLVPQIIQVGHG